MKHLSHLLTLGTLWIVAIALAGCTLMAPAPDKSRFFVLTPIGPGESGSALDQSKPRNLALGLGPIKFPDYLQRGDIVTWIEPNRLQYSDNDHWAEPLKDNFTSVFAQNLTGLLGTQQIVNFPWYSSTHIDYQIAVTMERFECNDRGQARLAADWSINDANGRALDGGQSDLNAPCGSNIDQAVAGLSQTLAAFSRQIAQAVVQVNATRSGRG
jgi:uncharacterized lipoprotein YmbA